MIDWHCHVLPCVDDGSQSVEESLEILKMLSEQGIDTVIATPHFYAEKESVASFIERRKNAYAELLPRMSDSLPKILLGAEVSYYSGIYHLEGLLELCIEGTEVILLEMPFERWQESTVREVELLSASGIAIVLLAHIERYIDMQDKGTLERLIDCGVIMQSNASFFCRKSSRRSAIKLLRSGVIGVLGSDAHNLDFRPPRLFEAYEIIEKKLGRRALEEINELGASLLEII